MLEAREALGAVVFLASDASSYVTGVERRRRRRLVGLVALPDVANLIDGRAAPARAGEWLDKLRPADESLLCRVARSGSADVDDAVAAARRAQPGWAERTAVARGDVVRELALLLRERREEASALVMEETGKPEELALGETDAAVEMGLFIAGEGRRSYGRTTTASMAHRTVLTLRQPLGVAALIMSFNTPLPNVAWKAFPAVFCGNAAVVKPSEHTPASASLFARARARGRRPGRRAQRRARARRRSRRAAGRARRRRSRQLHGLGRDRTRDQRGGGAPPGEDVPRARREERARRLRRRRPRERRPLGRRLGVLERRPALRLGEPDRRVRRRLRRVPRAARRRHDVARRRSPSSAGESLERMLASLDEARADGATVLAGGSGSSGRAGTSAPTVVEGAAPDAAISRTELFGPVTILYRAAGLDEAIALVNDSAVRPHGGDPHGERPSRDAIRRASAGRRRRRERRDARLRAAHGLRRREGLGHRLAGGRDRVARRVLRSRRS